MVRRNYNTTIYAGSQAIGQVEGDTFIKRVRSSIHMLRSPRGWALDVKSLEDAQEAGAKFVDLQDGDTKKTYRASIDHIWAKGFRFNRGFGDQICLVLKEWNKAEPEARQLEFQLC